MAGTAVLPKEYTITAHTCNDGMNTKKLRYSITVSGPRLGAAALS